MTQIQEVPKPKRIFYAVMGLLCVVMSLGVLSKILRDLFLGAELAYGKVGVFIQHPVIQGLHVVMACLLWTAVFYLGSQWLLRAKSGREAI